MEYLVFRLYGPMASWGEIAVGVNRHTARYPSKSALLGLLGAALGISREDEESQQDLFDYYAIAIKTVSCGSLLKDYHTTQVPNSKVKFRFRSRRDELVVGWEQLDAVVSSRAYRTDAQAIVAVSARAGACWSLGQLQEALQRPKYQLYLGRKACPLAAPLQAEIIAGDGFYTALNNYQPKPLLIGQPDWVSEQRYLKPDAVCHFYWQGSLAEFTGQSLQIPPQAVQQLVRHDQPLSRTRWQFQPRQENLWLRPLAELSDKEKV
ncbi:type I-E CRISPR-associated protein Cas5/CasD [Endozoicomonas sp. SESOKO1]|uniref:type I-E CRISPR-associated protein Cas5/CasD n=1 Tax=Endozoicomonas sp. SESOKO1 TaxID=2828742 RepID=UPI0021483C51|nr:type I-E CRISPR-associated protein Cas5/CasD [Endozoicomonas sp. SESOKO1]